MFYSIYSEETAWRENEQLCFEAQKDMADFHKDQQRFLKRQAEIAASKGKTLKRWDGCGWVKI